MHYRPILARARIGFIIPSSNRMVEPQVQHFMPDGVVPHFTRIGMTNRHKAPLDQLLPRILDATELLADSACDVTVLQCTGTSMSGGVDMEQHVIAEMERVSGKPALSAASCLTSAFQTLCARRLVFISETKQEGHDRKVAFLREAGYEIVADKAVGLANSAEYCSTPPERWFDEAITLRDDSADAYFISCANIRSIDVIERLESELGKPVVTSNQAAIWCSLRTCGIEDVAPGLGRLFEHRVARRLAAA
ncbi:MAG: maleate cis-trans isomerase [Hyphomicrobiales bacterium]|jgi:maleate isomerase|nr:maleate cis-trans isomerase [Hyphomicrobiales bacterium]